MVEFRMITRRENEVENATHLGKYMFVKNESHGIFKPNHYSINLHFRKDFDLPCEEDDDSADAIVQKQELEIVDLVIDSAVKCITDSKRHEVSNYHVYASKHVPPNTLIASPHTLVEFQRNPTLVEMSGMAKRITELEVENKQLKEELNDSQKEE